MSDELVIFAKSTLKDNTEIEFGYIDNLLCIYTQNLSSQRTFESSACMKSGSDLIIYSSDAGTFMKLSFLDESSLDAIKSALVSHGLREVSKLPDMCESEACNSLELKSDGYKFMQAGNHSFFIASEGLMYSFLANHTGVIFVPSRDYVDLQIMPCIKPTDNFARFSFNSLHGETIQEYWRSHGFPMHEVKVLGE
ncbi:hypothetical protein KW882_00800 [Vibrio parahaemolyticus]